MKKKLKTKHPLYQSWKCRRYRGTLGPKFQDFWAFAKWAESNGWTPGENCMIHLGHPAQRGRSRYSIKRRIRNSEEYPLWIKMWRNANISSEDGFEDVGARGLGLCNEWKDFFKFKPWAKEQLHVLRESSLKIELSDLQVCRRDRAKDYSPENCFLS